MSKPTKPGSLARRTFLKLGAAGVAALALRGVDQLVAPDLQRRGLYSADGVFDAASIALAGAIS